MDPATAHFKKFCPDLKTVGEIDVPCSTGYEYYNGICYKILEELEFVYSQAELGCLPEANTLYIKLLDRVITYHFQDMVL